MHYTLFLQRCCRKAVTSLQFDQPFLIVPSQHSQMCSKHRVACKHLWLHKWPLLFRYRVQKPTKLNRLIKLPTSVLLLWDHTSDVVWTSPQTSSLLLLTPFIQRGIKVTAFYSAPSLTLTAVAQCNCALCLKPRFSAFSSRCLFSVFYQHLFARAAYALGRRGLVAQRLFKHLLTATICCWPKLKVSCQNKTLQGRWLWIGHIEPKQPEFLP